MATTRTREIEQLKEQRRQDVRRRLEDTGWEEPDWTFPEFVARKWASLVDGPQALTERAWQKLYPRLVPYLEKNRESHQERSRMIRKGKRLRRIRRLLLGVRNATNLLEMDDEVILEFEDPDRSSAGNTTTNDTITSTPSANEHEPVGTVDLDGESGNSNDPTTIVFSKSVQAPFPPMIDLLKWPIIVNLLEADTDLDTIQDAFEASKGEIEAQIRSWRSTVEKELVDTLKAGTTGEDQGTHLDTEIPPLQLPPKSRLMDHITPDTRLLLRADSVFCASDDTVAPLPLHFPELFHILQDRPNDYFEVGFEECITYTIPKHGYTWDPSEVVSYPEGATAAKALLKELGRADAAHFELQELGARFTCGSCADKRLRTWDEMVQHYVKALTHANIAQKATAPVTYNNVHSLDISDKPKGKRKPLVTLHSVEDAKELSSRHQQWQNLVKCNLCDQLGIEFQSVRDVMVKHVRMVHSVKRPKAEHYKRTGSYYMSGPNRINDPVGNISDSTKATDQEMVKAISSSHSNYGQLGVHWSYYGSHFDLHPGWNQQDFS
ncbi:unnamed protein product [Rhizoctonia solani]|uniref:Uncharacterized protein n=1 Tax=Rhizoctonia solani TaxID=456999 RepID=A0A8H3DZQ8_9AGAM|nr:unnamed protein product [Rhizoctonia solani]